MEQSTSKENIEPKDFTDRINGLLNEAAEEDASMYINDIMGEYMSTKMNKIIHRIDSILNNYTKQLLKESKNNIALPEVIQTLLNLTQLKAQLQNQIQN